MLKKVAMPWILRFAFDTAFAVICVVYHTHWFILLGVLARTLGVDFFFLWFRRYAFDFDPWLTPQLVKSRFFLWLSKTVAFDPMFVVICIWYDSHIFVALLVLARTLGIDFVQLIIGTHRLVRLFEDEDENTDS